MLNSAHPATANADDKMPVKPVPQTGKVARITNVSVAVDGVSAETHEVASGKSEVVVSVKYESPSNLPTPNVGLCFVRNNGQIVASTGTHVDQYVPKRSGTGGHVSVTFPLLPLLKGDYQVDVYLMCEQGIHVYDCVNMAARLEVVQESLELGVVTLPHVWGD